MQIDLFGNVIKDNNEEEVKVHKPSPFDFIKSISAFEGVNVCFTLGSYF